MDASRRSPRSRFPLRPHVLIVSLCLLACVTVASRVPRDAAALAGVEADSDVPFEERSSISTTYSQPLSHSGSNSTARHGDMLPVVLWHGMGDTCCSPVSIGWLIKHLQDSFGVYVHSVNSGGGPAWADLLSGFLGNVNDIVAQVCQDLRADARLQGGFNLIGFSQGGQFARAVVQRCGHLGVRVRNLITLGAQHGGIVDVPECTAASWNGTESGVCKVLMALLGKGAYLPWVRNHIVQAQYFKDPFDLESYYAHNPFLPDINNEIAAERKQQYKENLMALERFVMFRFRQDYTVVPRDSAWFAWYDGKRLIAMEDQDLYKEDWLGLRQMHDTGRLIKDECPGMHMHFTVDWFDQNVIRPYLVYSHLV